jgi:hypothetical protein
MWTEQEANGKVDGGKRKRVRTATQSKGRRDKQEGEAVIDVDSDCGQGQLGRVRVMETRAVTITWEKQTRYARVTHCPLTCRSSTTSVTMSNVEQPDAKKRKVDDQHSSIAPVSGLLIKRLSEKAKLPTRGSALAAGYDLYRYSLVSTHQANAQFM